MDRFDRRCRRHRLQSCALPGRGLLQLRSNCHTHCDDLQRLQPCCLHLLLLSPTRYAAGNLSAYSFTATTSTPAAPDTTPPTAPTNLAATAGSSSQINLSWTASTDNVGVTGYKVERCQGAGCSNFAQIATPTTATFNDTGLTASTSYSYRVRATDAAGNLSPYSPTATASTTAFTIVVTISPKRGGIATSQTLGFTANVAGDASNAGVTWTKTGGTFSNTTLTSVTYSSAAAGSFTITATSNANNSQSASATVGVTDLAGITTYHNDLARDGVNAQEYALATSNVATATFAKLFSCQADGAIYGQPSGFPTLRLAAVPTMSFLLPLRAIRFTPMTPMRLPAPPTGTKCCSVAAKHGFLRTTLVPGISSPISELSVLQ